MGTAFLVRAPIVPFGRFCVAYLGTVGSAEPVGQREDLTKSLGNKPGSSRTLVAMVPKPDLAIQEGALSARLGQHRVHWGGASWVDHSPLIWGRMGSGPRKRAKKGRGVCQQSWQA